MKKIRKYLQEKNVENEEDSEGGDNDDGEAGMRRKAENAVRQQTDTEAEMR